MIEQNGKKAFGFFEGTPYGVITDRIDEMQKYGFSGLNEKKVKAHINSLSPWITSERTDNLFGVGEIQCGIFEDGLFVFPCDYVQYLNDGHVGIPYEYAHYLKEKGIV